jgi:hypothetical protein
MNLKTTLALLVLVAACAGLLALGVHLPVSTREKQDAGTREVLARLTPEKLKRIEVRRGDRVVVLERNGAGHWALPGNWPARPAEVEALVALLGGLRSRFEPEPLQRDKDLTDRGLKPPAATVILTTAGGTHTLAFGEPPDGAGVDPLAWPTYLRLDEKEEAVRLGPGIVAVLDRPVDYYQQRRLFLGKRVPRDEGSKERVERLDARGVEVAQKGGPHFRLRRRGEEWELARPIRDALDPQARDSLLEAVPDIWAEQFVPGDARAVASLVGLAGGTPGGPAALAVGCIWNTRKGLLVRAGLLEREPERTITVTRDDGTDVTLLIGRVAGAREKKVPAAAPPGAPPGMRLPDRTVREEYRYAKLKDNEQIFEIKADRLDNVFVALDTLRDNQLARFKPEDARRVEITTGKQAVVLVNEVDREYASAGAGTVGLLSAPGRGPWLAAAALYPDRVKARWKLVRPLRASAEPRAVDDLLNKLSGLSAQEKDVLERDRVRALAGACGLLAGSPLNAAARLYPERPDRAYGFDPPSAVVKVTAEEEVKKAGEVTGRKKKTWTVLLGRHDESGKKLYARSQDWPRVNEIDEGLAEVVLKKAADYRGKELFAFDPGALERVTVRRLDPGALAAPALLATPRGLLPGAAALAAGRTEALVLEKGAGGWRLTRPVRAPADAARVNDLARRLSKFEVLEYVDEEPNEEDLQEPYGLSVPELEVRLEFAGGPTPRTLLVGKPRSDKPGRFAKLKEGPAVFAVADDVYSLLDRGSLSYRPPELWKLPPGEEIVRLRVRKKGQEPYDLTRKGAGWQVSGPFTVLAPAEVVGRLTAALSAPRCLEYAAHSAPDLSAYGLNEPEVSVTLTTKGGLRHTLLVGGPAGFGGRFARHDSDPAVLVVGDDLARTADQSALDFLDRHVLKVDPGAVTAVRRRQGGEVLELVKKEDAWHLRKPADEPADERKVPELLRALSDVEARRIAAYPVKGLKPYGLDDPAATLTLTLGAGGKPAEHVLKVGAVADSASGDRYVQVDGGKAVAVVSGSLARRLLASPLAFRDHNLARFTSADRLRLESGPRKAAFAEVEGSWKLVEPLQADADHDALVAFHDSLARLRADELVAEKPTAGQLKSYGLDRPAARWRAESEGKVLLDLSVGAREKGGPRRYARVAGKELVFLLDPKLSAGVLAEYRPRNVWKDPLDAAQVESVRFGHASKPFELRKVDEKWEVAGKPGVKVDAGKVNETLSALRDPKLLHYAVDKGADLSLFGLKPPDLVLEVTTPSGKRTLHLGGREGGSKRRYARLPEPGRSDVFVLDGPTSERLFRHLSAFTAGTRRE